MGVRKLNLKATDIWTRVLPVTDERSKKRATNTDCPEGQAVIESVSHQVSHQVGKASPNEKA